VRNALQAKHDTEKQESDLSAHALAVAVVAARRASKLILESVSGIGDLEWVEKASADFVTEVDRAAEAAITKVVRAEFPDAIIIGEELTPEAAMSGDELTFISDPLDGTTNFLHGFPHYAVSIGAMHKSEMIAAVVVNVPRGDIFTARAGHGTKLNDKPVTVSSIDSTSRALIGTGFPFKNLEVLEEYSRQFIEVTRHTSGIRRAGSAALDLADVACGRFDGFWELVLAPWDVAAGILLVREAGGIVTDTAGRPAPIAHGPIVAGNPVIHPWLLQTVQAATDSR
jgi:myo-inositol-1(or 4)-monophosphatase